MKRPFLARALLGTSPVATAPLAGLRSFFNYVVVSGHTPVFTSFVSDEPEHLSKLDPSAGVLARLWNEGVNGVGLYASVDIFLFLSGFFLMASLTRMAGDNPTSSSLLKCKLRPRLLARYIFSRWLRLVPVYLLTAGLLWAVGEPSCVHGSELVFMSNLFYGWGQKHPMEDACLGVGWSLQVDFQSHILIGVLMLFIPSGQMMYKVLIALAGLSGLVRAVAWEAAGRPQWLLPTMMDYIHPGPGQDKHIENLREFLQLTPGTFNLSDPMYIDRKEKMAAYTPFYNWTAFRGGVVCSGAATWLAMRENSRICRVVRSRPIVSLLSVAVAWGVFCASWAMHIFGTIGPSLALFEGFARLVLGAGLGLLTMVTCDVGQTDEGRDARPSRVVRIVRSVLGNHIGIWLGRVSYAVYLTHIISAFCLGFGWPVITKERYTMAAINWAGVKWYAVAVVAAVPFCIVEEFALRYRRRFVDAIFGQGDVQDKGTAARKED